MRHFLSEYLVATDELLSITYIFLESPGGLAIIFYVFSFFLFLVCLLHIIYQCGALLSADFSLSKKYNIILEQFIFHDFRFRLYSYLDFFLILIYYLFLRFCFVQDISLSIQGGFRSVALFFILVINLFAIF